MAVTAEAVKLLRERTGAGMMECKKALVESGGDLEVAAENALVHVKLLSHETGRSTNSASRARCR